MVGLEDTSFLLGLLVTFQDFQGRTVKLQVVDFKLPCFPSSRGGLHCSLGPSGARINGSSATAAAAATTLVPGGGDDEHRTFNCQRWLLGGSSQLGHLEGFFLQTPGKRQTISMEKNTTYFFVLG